MYISLKNNNNIIDEIRFVKERITINENVIRKKAVYLLLHNSGKYNKK